MVIFGPNQCQVAGCPEIGVYTRDVDSHGMTIVQIRMCANHNETYEQRFWEHIRGGAVEAMEAHGRVTDLSHLDSYYPGGPVTPMSKIEAAEKRAWEADYTRRMELA